jgi:hypothetical protein
MAVKIAALSVEDIIDVGIGFVGFHAHEDSYHSGLKNVCGGSDSHWENNTQRNQSGGQW